MSQSQESYRNDGGGGNGSNGSNRRSSKRPTPVSANKQRRLPASWQAAAESDANSGKRKNITPVSNRRTGGMGMMASGYRTADSFKVNVTGMQYRGDGTDSHSSSKIFGPFGSRQTLTTGTMSTLYSVKSTPGSSSRPTPTTSQHRGSGHAVKTRKPTRHRRKDEAVFIDPSTTLLQRLPPDLASPAYRRSGFLIRSWNSCFVQITGSVMILWDGHTLPYAYVALDSSIPSDTGLSEAEFKRVRKQAKKRNQKVVRLHGYTAKIDKSIKPKTSSPSVTSASFSPSFTFESPSASPVPSDFVLGSSLADPSGFSPYQSSPSSHHQTVRIGAFVGPATASASDQQQSGQQHQLPHQQSQQQQEQEQQRQQQQQQQQQNTGLERAQSLGLPEEKQHAETNLNIHIAGSDMVRFVVITMSHPTERSYNFSVDATHADYWLHVINRSAQTPNISDFAVMKQIGTGGYGKVFLVRHHETRKLYAMKQIRKYVKPKPMLGPRGETLTSKTAMRDQRIKTRQRQQRHIRYMIEERIALQSLGSECPFVCRAHMSFEDNLFWYFVLDFCPGGDVFHHAQKQALKCFDENTVRTWMAELITALQYMHARNWAHRDIKPENLLLDADGHLRLADLGFIKQLPEPFEGSNSFCGTKYYIAPEMLVGDRKHGFAVDLWALGVLVYELTCGIPPFYHKRRQRVYEMILNDPVFFPDDVALSGAVKHFITALLIKDPQHRMGTGPEGIAALRRHTWFKDVDWRAIELCRVRPGFVPPLKRSIATLVQHTQTITDEELESVIPPQVHLSELLNYMPSKDGLEPIVDGSLVVVHGFDYVAPEYDDDLAALAHMDGRGDHVDDPDGMRPDDELFVDGMSMPSTNNGHLDGFPSSSQEFAGKEDE